MEHYNDLGYLYHYGVLGMKWGHRKQKDRTTSRYTKTYREASATQIRKANKYESKAAKARAKAKRYNAVAKKSYELDKKVQSRISSSSLGKNIVSTLLSLPSNPRAYATMREAGVSRGKAILTSMTMGPTYGELKAREKYVQSVKKSK